MKYVRCVSAAYWGITVGKIYEIINSSMLYIDNYFFLILDDYYEYKYYSKIYFIDVTREIKLEKILNEIC